MLTWCGKPVECFGPCHLNLPPHVNVCGAVKVARCFTMYSRCACMRRTYQVRILSR